MATKRTSKSAILAHGPREARGTRETGEDAAEPAEKPEKPRKLLLTDSEVAALLGNVSTKTILRERQRGRIRAVNVGRRKFIPYFEAERYVKMLWQEQGFDLADATILAV